MRMRRRDQYIAGGAVAVAGLLALAGVQVASANEPKTATLGEVVDDGSARQTLEVLANDNIRKDLGEPGELVSDSGQVLFSLTVTSVEAANGCPSRAHDLAEVEGDFLLVDVQAEMADSISDHVDGDEMDMFLPLGAEAFTVFDDRGVAVEGAATVRAWECYPDEELLAPFARPGHSSSGLLVLDTDLEHGSIAYTPAGAAGWQWFF